MRILLDDQPLTAARPTMAGAIEAARAAAEARQRVITDVLLDGRPVAEEDLASPPETLVPPGSEVRFLSADPVALVRASLEDAATALDGVRDVQQSAAHAIQVGRMDQAMPSLADAMTVWETARRVMADTVALLGLDPQTLTLPAGDERIGLGAAMGALASRLTEIKRCLTAQDWPGLSDVLAYDLGDQAARWAGMLRALSAELAASTGEDAQGAPPTPPTSPPTR